MSRHVQFRPDSEYCCEHPASLAWRTLFPGAKKPTGIEVLMTSAGRHPNRKSRVYRLTGAYTPSRPIIAKRTRVDSVRLERRIYEEILPTLPVTSLRCFGAVETSEEHAWLFLEEARGVPYDEEDDTHRALATRWLGAVHTATSCLDLSNDLPPHEASLYHAYLSSGRKRIEPNLENPALTCRDRDTLTRVLEHWEVLESRWADLEVICAEMPRCLVHGDFVKKNVRIHQGPEGAAVYPLDWDIAGWGPPGVDIERLDPAAYLQEVAEAWPHFGLDEIRTAADVGVILRNVGLIHATAIGLEYDWVERTMLELTEYEKCLARVLSSEGWLARRPRARRGPAP